MSLVPTPTWILPVGDEPANASSTSPQDLPPQPPGPWSMMPCSTAAMVTARRPGDWSTHSSLIGSTGRCRESGPAVSSRAGCAGLPKPQPAPLIDRSHSEMATESRRIPRAPEAPGSLAGHRSSDGLLPKRCRTAGGPACSWNESLSRLSSLRSGSTCTSRSHCRALAPGIRQTLRAVSGRLDPGRTGLPCSSVGSGVSDRSSSGGEPARRQM
ncbi:hypothetical protein BH24ACT15_BH24ACT15_20560 [soil metagenome]